MVDVKTDVVETLKDLRTELQALAGRISLLELEKTPRTPLPVAVEAPAAVLPAPQKTPEIIPEEILQVIAAAVAAYLGERVPIHQIRLISSPGWAVQGRVSIQASHYLSHLSR